MFEKNKPLSIYSNYKIGGPAEYFYRAKNVREIKKALDYWRRFNRNKNGQNLPASRQVFILGGGTNLLIDDEGFSGLVLKPEIKSLKAEGEMVYVGAGVLVSELLEFLIQKSFSGLEWAGGLPGTVGGAIRGNAGAFGGEIKDVVKEITSLDISKNPPKIIKRTGQECAFGYRSSIFKFQRSPEIITEAVLVLQKGDKNEIRRAIEEKINYRKEHQPLEYPNIGSTFKNVDLSEISKDRHKEFQEVIKTDPFPVIPAAYLIDQCGLKGVSFGGAMISLKHPNFIVNILNARASDVKNLINLAKNEVEKKFNIKLEEEIVYV